MLPGESPILHFNNLSLATFLPSVTNKVHHNRLNLVDHLLTPHNLQEIPSDKVDFSLFTDGSYLKGDNVKYCTGYAIINTFDTVVEATSLSVASLVQQAGLHTLTQGCTLAKDKTANIYTDSRCTLRIVHGFRMLWKQHGFLTFCRNRIKNGPNAQE